MNITAFLNYLNKTRGWAIDADYYGYIETWRQWWQGSVPKVHTRAAEYANGPKKRPIASLRMPKRVCEDWANLLLNDRTTFQIKELTPRPICWATMSSRWAACSGSCTSGAMPMLWWNRLLVRHRCFVLSARI